MNSTFQGLVAVAGGGGHARAHRLQPRLRHGGRRHRGHRFRLDRLGLGLRRKYRFGQRRHRLDRVGRHQLRLDGQRRQHGLGPAGSGSMSGGSGSTGSWVGIDRQRQHELGFDRQHRFRWARRSGSGSAASAASGTRP